MGRGNDKAWVASAAVAGILGEYLQRPGSLSGRRLADTAGVDPKMLRKVLRGDVAWTTHRTAEALLCAAGLEDQLIDLETQLIIPA